jgi:hypothetical protein
MAATAAAVAAEATTWNSKRCSAQDAQNGTFAFSAMISASLASRASAILLSIATRSSVAKACSFREALRAFWALSRADSAILRSVLRSIFEAPTILWTTADDWEQQHWLSRLLYKHQTVTAINYVYTTRRHASGPWMSALQSPASTYLLHLSDMTHQPAAW